MYLLLVFTCLTAAALTAWPYGGYPLWLSLLARLKQPRHRNNPAAVAPTQRVTLVISAFNEEKVIEEKIVNALQLDYPSELLEIMVVSDASEDSTDHIVARYANQGVQLCRQDERKGKSAGLTRFVPQANGDFVVFTDANALFDSKAIQHLIVHFNDPRVGYVVGQQKYRQAPDDPVGSSEGLYWKYETWLKTMESKVDSVVGGDGAIYAIRKELFQPLREDDINDFLNPLQIIAAGFGGVYEPNAVCFEDVAGSFAGEYRRKVRIANRSIRALFRVPSVLNPWRSGWFAFHVFSHKLLRWLGGFFMLIALLTNLVLASYESGALLWRTLLGFQVAFYSLALLGTIPGVGHARPFRLPFYFCLGNLAASHGVLNYFLGIKHVTWTPDRGQTHSKSRVWFIVALVLLTAGALLLPFLFPVPGLIASACLVGYTFAVYPLFMGWMAGRKKTLSSLPQLRELPPISIVIPMHNEASCIAQKLENAISANYPADLREIIVIDDASTDEGWSIVQAWADSVTLVRQRTRGGKAAAMRRAIEVAKHDTLVFTDANVRVDVDAFRHLVTALQPGHVGASTADVRFVGTKGTKAEKDYQKYEFQLLVNESHVGSAICVDGALYAIKRTALRPPDADCILDDFAISTHVINSGANIAVSPLARAEEPLSPSLKAEFYRRVRLGKGIAQILVKGHFPRANWPILFQFVSHKLARWFSPFFIVGGCLGLLKWVAMHYDLSWPQIAAMVGVGASCIGLAVILSFWLRSANYIGYSLTVLIGMTWGLAVGLVTSPTAAWDHAPRQSWNDENR